MSRFDDPNYYPPRALSASENRDYEEAVLAVMRDALTAPQWGWIESFELDGVAPDTVVFMVYRDGDEPGRFAIRIPIWPSANHEDDPRVDDLLLPAAEVARDLFAFFEGGAPAAGMQVFRVEGERLVPDRVTGEGE